MSKLTRRNLLQAAAATAAISAVGTEVKAESAADSGETKAQKQLFTQSPIEVYTNTLSAAPGEEVTIHVSTTAPRFTLQIARIGKAETVVWTKDDLPGVFYPTPDDAWEKGCRWPAAVPLKIPADWKSGYYQIKGTVQDQGQAKEFLAFIVVRAAKPTAKILLVLSTNTYAAYNNYGGASLYEKKSRTGGGEHSVSFQRPWIQGFLWKPDSYDVDAELASGKYDARGVHKESGIPAVACAAGFHNWERVMVAWLEEKGYAVDYAVNADLELHPELIKGYRLMLSVGHDEYWSSKMRDTVESFIQTGGNVCFFSGNVAYWQVRFEDQGRSMVCYKLDYANDPYFKDGQKHLTTTVWSSHHIGRPESRMTGLSFWYAGFSRFRGVVGQGPGGYLVYRPEHWVFKNTGMHYGDCLGPSSEIVHYETDGCPIRMEDGLPYPASFHDGPASLEILGMIPAALDLRDYGGTSQHLADAAKDVFGPANPKAVEQVSSNQGHAVMSIYTNNGTVFCAGTTDWTNGLKGRDPAVEGVTKNLMDRLSV
jgi:hypothetical protein